MRLRRRRLLTSLASDEISPTVTSFPRMGVGKFYDVDLPFDASSSLSEYVPDFVINPHPRFGALTRNIRARRGSKVDIRVPLFHDSQTPEFLRLEDPSSIPIVYARSDPSIKLEPDTSIHMDCMAFGMGMCSLQVTFQGKDVDESRYMYDQLAILSPIMMAMTAASPIYKGRLSDVDARWNVIAASVDDRTPAERGEVAEDDMQRAVDPLLGGGGVRRQIKSRYDSVSTYIYHCNGEPACLRTFERYNDIICPVDDDTKTLLLDAGIDINLAHHIVCLFLNITDLEVLVS
jgi:glutamate--cysteine ligase catalytic subunit